MSILRRLIVLSLILSSTGLINATSITSTDSQSAPAGTEGNRNETYDSILSIGEVRVTAIKQARSLLRQPVTVTTIRRDEIERQNITGMKGVSEIAPNFYMPSYGSQMTSSIYVRGIGARIDQPAVGLNIDNVPYLNKDSYDFDMADIDRIEVLRGPQSTLYGRNTIAGLINIYTISPLRYQGVKAMVEAGTGSRFRASVAGYAKLHERLGMSLSAYADYRHGFFKNRFNGSRADRQNNQSLRWKTVWRAGSNVSIENAASFGHSVQNGYPYAFEETGDINYNDTCFYKRTTFTDGVTVTWVTPHFTLASITGFQYLNDNMTLDQDFLPKSYFNLTQKQNDRSITQDIVLRGSTGNYSWLAGVFGFYKYSHMGAPVTFKEDGIKELILGNIPPIVQLTWDDDNFVLGSNFRHPVKGAAIYHQSTYDWKRWSFALGMRLDYEHTVLNYHSLCSTGASGVVNIPQMPFPIPLNAPVDIDESGRMKQSFTQFLPKLSVTYNLKNSAVFLSVTKGYKSGGYNTQMFSNFLQQQMMTEMMDNAMGQMRPGGRADGYDNPGAGTTNDNGQLTAADYVSYKPEISWNYELGGHISCDEGRVYSTFAAFFIDCRDQQVTIFPEGTSTGRMMANAGKTRSVGAELTISYTPAPRWKFDVAYGYTHATFRDFKDAYGDYSGNRVPYAPENTLFAAGSYRLPVANSPWLDAVSFNLNCRGVGSIYWDEENEYRQPFYAELGASVRLEHRNFTLDIWGKNLTDTKFDTFRYESIGNNFFQRGNPVRGGVTLRLAFN